MSDEQRVRRAYSGAYEPTDAQNGDTWVQDNIPPRRRTNMERTITLSNGAVVTVTFDGNWLTLTSSERNGLVILMNQVDSLEAKKAQLPAQSTSGPHTSNEEGGTEPEL